MSRKAELETWIKAINERGGVYKHHQDQFKLGILTDIAMSLAVIADALSEKEEQDEQ